MKRPRPRPTPPRTLQLSAPALRAVVGGIGQTSQRDTIGDARDYEKEPATVEFPNLSF